MEFDRHAEPHYTNIYTNMVAHQLLKLLPFRKRGHGATGETVMFGVL